MQTTTACPDEATLQRLARGLMPEPLAGPLEKHLQGCPGCAAAHDALFAPLIDSLRSCGPIDTPHPDQEEIEKVIPRLEALGRPAALTAPQRLGPYRVLRLLGEGGMGVICEGEDEKLKRRVALKTIKPAGAGSRQLRERFRREAQALAALDHENVVPVWHVDEQDGVPFLVMPLLKGETLAARRKREPRPPLRLALQIGREVAEGLAAAHEAGLIHRDVQPANVWLEERGDGVRVRLLDFGLARAEKEAALLTRAGTLLGTPRYMAPEQARGETVDGRADLFSLGCILYELTTGSRPFDGPSVLAVLSALENRRLRPPREVAPEVPGALSDLVLQLLEKRPQRRPASARDVARRLEAVERQMAGPSAATPARRRPALMLVALVAMLLLPGGYFFGGTVVRFATNQGQVVIEADDPDLEVTVTNKGAVIIDPKGKRTVTLSAGDHELEVTVKEGGGEVRFFTTAFTLKRGGRQVVHVRREPAQANAVVTPRPTSEREIAEWVLSVGGGLAVYRVGGKAVTPRGVKDLPPGEFRFSTIDLRGCEKVLDADLARFSRPIYVGILDLGKTSITGSGLAHLGSIIRLGDLRLDSTEVDDAGLRHLAALTELAHLRLDATRVTGEGLVRLKGLTQLYELRLSDTKVSDEGLRHLQPLQKLRILHLVRTEVTDDGLALLEPLRRLEQLVLDGSSIGDAGLKHLYRLRHLKVLHLAGTKVTLEGVAALKKALPDCKVMGTPGDK